MSLGQKACRLAFAVGVAAIVALSLLPQPSMPDVQLSDKANHTLAYGCVMLAGGLGFWLGRQRLLLAGGLFLLGGAMELLQGLTPTRQMSLLDMVANTIGIAVGLLLAVLLTRYILQQPAKKAL
ncbi:MAG TPA: hypothetical protein VKN76_16195 [Kiloniellaceae bacterium]|nr:hypothetical protein [Kiloniellaceae bacterium]